MQELIAVQTHDTLINAVCGRELHERLEIGKDYSSWIRDQITRADLLENIDYLVLPQKGELAARGFRTAIEYLLSLDAAKNVALLSQTPKGKEVRAYFIECEKRLHAPMTEMQMISRVALEMDAANQRIAENTRRIEAIEAKQSAITEGFSYFTILAFANLNHINIDLPTAAKLGKRAAKLSRDMDVPIDSVRDPRFGSVFAYKEAILKQVFAEALQE